MTSIAAEPGSVRTTKPRVGVVGAGWIGRQRMQALLRSGLAEVAAIADPSPSALEQALGDAPGAAAAPSMEHLLSHELEGVVIATPSAMHAAQAIGALERGLAVFCQKPLARTADETRKVVEAAGRTDRLLGVDLSYRFTTAFQRIHALIRAGELGDLFAIDLTFHNAYGPNKGWATDPALSCGGCLIDLGVHLVDLALLVLGRPVVTSVSGRLFSQGSPLTDPVRRVEDHAIAEFSTDHGVAVRVACSWWCNAGQDAEIEAVFRGSRATAALRNVRGSFSDFEAHLMRGAGREVIARPPDEWPGRAVLAWADRLGRGSRFDPEVRSAVAVAEVLDRMYAR